MKLSELKKVSVNGLIGFKATIKRSADKSLQGLKGKIVDETLKTLTMRTEKGEKVVSKEIVVLEVEYPDGTIEVSGKEVLQRPHERLKKLWRKVK